MSNTHRKQTFQHAMRCLAHPVSLLSMAILAFNDYYLRIHHPSWFTGKLGDVAWLFFFPLFLTAIFVWILPKKWLKGNIPILFGIGVTTFLFTVGKIWAPFLQIIIDAIETFVPWNVGWIIDPSDLIALPILGFVYLLWTKLSTPLISQNLRLN